MVSTRSLNSRMAMLISKIPKYVSSIFKAALKSPIRIQESSRADGEGKSVSFANAVTTDKVQKRFAFPVVENYVFNAWGKYGIQKIMMNAKGFYFFKFSTKKGVNDVLETSGHHRQLSLLHRWWVRVVGEVGNGVVVFVGCRSGGGSGRKWGKEWREKRSWGDLRAEREEGLGWENISSLLTNFTNKMKNMEGQDGNTNTDFLYMVQESSRADGEGKRVSFANAVITDKQVKEVDKASTSKLNVASSSTNQGKVVFTVSNKYFVFNKVNENYDDDDVENVYD
nr:hypothetical protein [Tanacetum cinerariifolium]